MLITVSQNYPTNIPKPRDSSFTVANDIKTQILTFRTLEPANV